MKRILVLLILLCASNASAQPWHFWGVDSSKKVNSSLVTAITSGQVITPVSPFKVAITLGSGYKFAKISLPFTIVVSANAETQTTPVEEFLCNGVSNDTLTLIGRNLDNTTAHQWNATSFIRYELSPALVQAIIDSLNWLKTSGPGSGTLTNVATAAPLTGGPITTTGTIAIPKATAHAQGYLDSTDWVAFNSKLSALSASSPLTYSSNVIGIPAASGSSPGYLTQTDWNTFNSKMSFIDTTSHARQVLTNIPGVGLGWSSAGSGTLTSMDVSGGLTGLAFSGGPITVSGVVTMTGVLGIGNGGTGASNRAAALNNLLPDSAAHAGGFLQDLPGGGYGWIGGVGTGTVTSVGLTLPTGLAVSGSPVTSTGTLAVSWNTQSANKVFAGPTSGGATTPTFRSLVAADLPAIGWGLTGNASTTYGTNFIGTTDAQSLQFRVNNAQAGIIEYSGSFNTSLGASTLPAATTGVQNVAVGISALHSNTSGNNNTALGGQALNLNTTGIENTAVGFQALVTNTTGSGNTALGYLANVGSANLTNATAIGLNAIVTASNAIQLGSSSVTLVTTYGQLASVATTNQLLFGATNTTTITSPAPSASRIDTILDYGANAHFIATNTIGASGQVLKSNGNALPTWQTAGLANPMTTTGDIIYSSDNSGTPARLAIGATNKVLTVIAGIPSWTTPATAYMNGTTAYSGTLSASGANNLVFTNGSLTCSGGLNNIAFTDGTITSTNDGNVAFPYSTITSNDGFNFVACGGQVFDGGSIGGNNVIMGNGAVSNNTDGSSRGHNAIVGGVSSTITSSYSAIIGGGENGGGSGNSISGSSSFIGAGVRNVVSGGGAAIVAGYTDSVTQGNSVALGGYMLYADGWDQLVIGRNNAKTGVGVGSGMQTSDSTLAAFVIGNGPIGGTRSNGLDITLRGNIHSYATTNQLLLGKTGHVITISSLAPAAASQTYTIPDVGGAGTFSLLYAPQVISGDGAIQIPNTKSQTVMLTKNSAAAITIVNPAAGPDDGKSITIITTTAQAHVITCSSDGFNAKGSSGTITYAPAVGNATEIVAYNGHWYVVVVNGVTIL